MRKHIVAMLVDHAELSFLKSQGLSRSEIAERFSGNQTANLTPDQAEQWVKHGFAEWGIRGRLFVTARLEAFPKLRGLSTKVGELSGSEGNAAKSRKDWVGPYLRGRFLKFEHKEESDV